MEPLQTHLLDIEDYNFGTDACTTVSITSPSLKHSIKNNSLPEKIKYNCVTSKQIEDALLAPHNNYIREAMDTMISVIRQRKNIQHTQKNYLQTLADVERATSDMQHQQEVGLVDLGAETAALQEQHSLALQELKALAKGDKALEALQAQLEQLITTCEQEWDTFRTEWTDRLLTAIDAAQISLSSDEIETIKRKEPLAVTLKRFEALGLNIPSELHD